jgi:hypothetical protein
MRYRLPHFGFRFRLRSLLIFVTVCAVVCSPVAVRLRRVERQRLAISAVRVVDVAYDCQMDEDSGHKVNPSPPAQSGSDNSPGMMCLCDCSPPIPLCVLEINPPRRLSTLPFLSPPHKENPTHKSLTVAATVC